MIEIKSFLGIHHLLPPVQFAACHVESTDIDLNTKDKPVVKKKEKKGNKDAADANELKKNTPNRATIFDSRKSTLMICDYGQNVQEEIMKYAEQQMQKKIRFHPLMAVTLDKFKKPSKYYVFVDSIYLQVKSFKTCIDTYMKIFFVLNLEYPPEGQKVNKFLAELFFKFESNDAIVRALVKDIKKI